MAGLRTSLALALVVAVVSEMISGQQGHRLLSAADAEFALRTADMFSAIILLAVVAYALNRIFVAWEGRVIHWARTREAAWSSSL